MRFYKQQHQFYCGVDLHAKTMHVCLVNQAGDVLVHRNLPTEPERFLNAISPYRAHDVVVGVECMFTWYWLADLCAQHGMAFVLGHALYMKAIHGGKAKNDKIDSEKIAMLLRGGMLPGRANHQATDSLGLSSTTSRFSCLSPASPDHLRFDWTAARKCGRQYIGKLVLSGADCADCPAQRA